MDVFAARIESPIPILLVTGIVAVLPAWVTVAMRPFGISRSNPVMALRY